VIAHLSGTLLDKQVQRLVVDVSGVGYAVHVPLSTFYGIGEPGASVSLHVHTHVREEALQLFGFATSFELQVFERLISVNGIGPKLALAVLSGIEPAALVRAVEQSDLGRLTNIPGIGRKTAERIVIELRDRLPKATSVASDTATSPGDDTREDVLSALANLGWSRQTAEKTVDKVLRRSEADAGIEAILREVLRELAG
jgi:Holliday junction DNA helicase RuvA